MADAVSAVSETLLMLYHGIKYISGIPDTVGSSSFPNISANLE
jgi:hypothetical protein